MNATSKGRNAFRKFTQQSQAYEIIDMMQYIGVTIIKVGKHPNYSKILWAVIYMPDFPRAEQMKPAKV